MRSKELSCETCGKKLIGSQRKYCSNKCNGRSETRKKNRKKWKEKNQEKCRESSKKGLEKFRRENPGRFNELMRNNYKKNKTKWRSRNNTNFLVNGRNGWRIYPLERFCKKCGIEEDLQIHHETYPTKRKEIIGAIDDGKIYCLCKKHHQEKGKYNR